MKVVFVCLFEEKRWLKMVVRRMKGTEGVEFCCEFFAAIIDLCESVSVE